METSTEIIEVIQNTYKTFGSGDATGIMKHISQQEETLVIGTDPDEWWYGYERIAKALNAQEEALPGGTLTGNPRAYRHGDVGWYEDHVTFTLKDGTEIPMRATGVLEKESGEWKIVQWHFSMGIPSQDTEFGELDL